MDTYVNMGVFVCGTTPDPHVWGREECDAHPRVVRIGSGGAEGV